MAKAPEYRTSAAQWDGAMPVLISSGRLTWATSEALAPAVLVPFNATIEDLQYAIITAATATNAAIEVGTSADDNHFLTAFTVATSITGGPHSLMSATELVNAEVDAGDIVEFLLPVAGAAGGVVVVTAALIPRSG